MPSGKQLGEYSFKFTSLTVTPWTRRVAFSFKELRRLNEYART